MKKMIAALAVLFSITLSAQNDAKAKALLDEVYTKVNGYENIYVDYKARNKRECYPSKK